MNMYKVLLIDDEPSVTDALRRSISWESYGLEVAAVAKSGREGLGFIERTPIDIVITDIRMADMDGLSLCQQISEMERNIQTIIISGFAEFSYAQKAISYGALGYCLKPLEYDELKRYLLHAVRNLKQADNLPDYDDLLDALQNSDGAELDAALSSFGFDSDAYYAAVSVGKAAYPLPKKQGVVLRLGYNQFAYFSPLPFSREKIAAFAQKSQTYGISCTESAKPVAALPKAIRDLNNSAFQFFFDQSRKIFPEKVEDSSAPLLKEIAKAAALGNTERTLSLLSSLEGPDGKGFTLRSAWRLYGIVSSVDAFSAAALEDINSPAQLVLRFQSFSSLLSALQERLFADPPVQKGDGLSNSRFIQMMSYINSHYDQGLSLSQLSKEMNLNANYLSQVFKKETGKTFLKYITELRIEKAKELLDSGNSSVSQIASQLGFNDYFYFLKTFKRVTGLTPKQYKQGL